VITLSQVKDLVRC